MRICPAPASSAAITKSSSRSARKRPRVTRASSVQLTSEMIETGAARTAAAAAGRHVLLIQDTSEINYQAKAGRKRGLGLRPPAISWGILLQDAQNVQVLAGAPWLLSAAVPVILVILAFNFLGDGVRDAADPYG